jgi:Holliday junction DNA helicase RuvA
MITKLTGTLNRLLDDRARVQVGPIEYELLISDLVHRQLHDKVGQEVALHTSHYLEAGAMQSKIVPRLLAFNSEAELEFFELFCTVDKVGVRRALKALAQPIRDIAEAIQREDDKYLSALPGIGKATAEKIVAALKKKVAKFCLMRGPLAAAPEAPLPSLQERLYEEAYAGLLSVGHGPAEARQLLSQALARGKEFETVEDLLFAVYQQSR